MGTISERIREERERLGFSQADFATLAGQGRSSQIRYEAGERSPDGNYFASLAAAGADILYIMTGLRSSHPMLKLAQQVDQLLEPSRALLERFQTEVSDLGDNAEDDLTVDHEHFALIRRHDVNLSAGPGLIPTNDDTADYMAFSRAWLRNNLIKPADAGLVRVRGESMAPTIPDGALVLVHMAERRVEREGIYAFSRDGAVYIKRLIPIGRAAKGDLGTILIVSDNPATPSEAVQGDEVEQMNIAGRVRCVLFSV